MIRIHRPKPKLRKKPNSNKVSRMLKQKESAEQERQRMIAEAKATSEKLKKDQEAKQLAEAQAVKLKNWK